MGDIPHCTGCGEYPGDLVADRIEELEVALKSQTHLIEQFFALLGITEETDDGRVFRPNTVRSCRVLDTEKLNVILAGMKRSVTANGKSDG